MSDIPRLALSPKDLAEMTPRGISSVREACQAGLIDATQNGGRRWANWVITPEAAADWIRRGCPIPQYSHSRKSA